MPGRTAAPISFKVCGTIPINQIPKDEFDSPYAKALRAIAKAPANHVVQLKCGTHEEARRLASRLYATGKGSLLARVPKGSRYVYVGAKAKSAPKAKKATKKVGKSVYKRRSGS